MVPLNSSRMLCSDAFADRVEPELAAPDLYGAGTAYTVAVHEYTPACSNPVPMRR